jgi:hypothetical protein
MGTVMLRLSRGPEDAARRTGRSRAVSRDWENQPEGKQRMSTINFNDAVCAKIRKQLDPYLSNDLAVETSHDLMKHMEGCPHLRSGAGIENAGQKSSAVIDAVRNGFSGFATTDGEPDSPG